MESKAMPTAIRVLVGLVLFLLASLVAGAPGKLLVSSYHNDAIVQFDVGTGRCDGYFVPPGNGGLDGPWGLTIGPDGHLYVCCLVGSKILKFHGQTGAPLGVFVPSGSGGMQGATNISFGPDGHLYVAAGYSNAVHRFHGGTGASLGLFVSDLRGAEGLGFFGGRLYVSSNWSDDVRRFAANGQYQGVYGSGMDWATGVCFSSTGELLVGSFFDDSVFRFNPGTGQLLGRWDFLDSPTGLAMGSGHDLYVTENLSDSVTCIDDRTGYVRRIYYDSSKLNGPTGIVVLNGLPRPKSRTPGGR
jgi:DNA-binding beta-propeller fold protein YncE